MKEQAELVRATASAERPIRVEDMVVFYSCTRKSTAKRLTAFGERGVGGGGKCSESEARKHVQPSGAMPSYTVTRRLR